LLDVNGVNVSGLSLKMNLIRKCTCGGKLYAMWSAELFICEKCKHHYDGDELDKLPILNEEQNLWKHTFVDSLTMTAADWNRANNDAHRLALNQLKGIK
jgi:hypothetical protein